MLPSSVNPSSSLEISDATGKRPSSGTRDQNAYAQILRSTGLIAGSSVVSVACGIVRSKAMALLVGPSGVGLMGLYSSIADLGFGIAGMGIQSSGVRQIAEAAGSGEPLRIARTAAVLRRVSVLLGVLGAALMMLFARAIAELTFGTSGYVAGVTLLAAAVFLRLVSDGRSALIQGMRRIGDLARMNVIAAVIGTSIGILLIYLFGEAGVVPSLVAVAAATAATSWWYSRGIQIQVPSLPLSVVWREASALLRLGFAFMSSALLTMGAAYSVRLIVLREGGLDAAGLFQAAWAIGNLFVGFILQALGTDFYPRLTAVHTDRSACNALVNQQARISFLLATPGLLATLTFAPVVIGVFYAARFDGAVVVLRWLCLGMTLRVVAWPMGFIVLAKGEQRIFLATEIAATIVHVGLTWFCVGRLGLEGAGVAFFGLYLWHSVLIYLVVRRLTGFRWSAGNRRQGLLLLPLTGACFVANLVLPAWLAMTIGSAAVIASSIYSASVLLTLVPLHAAWAPIRIVADRLRLSSATGDRA